jgi:NADH:ubiquinone oxidoreductase subunit E
MTQSEIEAIIERYGRRESAILAILQDIQDREKYLPKVHLAFK